MAPRHYAFVDMMREGPFETLPEAIMSVMSRVKQLPDNDDLPEILAGNTGIQIALFENVGFIFSFATVKDLAFALGLTTEDGTPVTPMPNIQPGDIDRAYLRIERQKPNKARTIVEMYAQHAGMIQN